ncbi:MAG: hypothetical protein WCJ56_13930, partial [bacterium]
FWGLYPRQEDKAQAWTRFNPLLERLKPLGHGLETLMKATDNYANLMALEETPVSLIKLPATFLYRDPEDIIKQAAADPEAIFAVRQQRNRGMPAGGGMGVNVSGVPDPLAGKVKR